MTNLTERLEKHLQSIREEYSEMSIPELFHLFSSNLENIEKLKNICRRYGVYQSNNLGTLIDHIQHKDPTDLYMDSYIPNPECYDFMNYCICKYLKVESGISMIKAEKSLEKVFNAGITKFEKLLKNYSYLQTLEDSLEEIQDYVDDIDLERLKISNPDKFFKIITSKLNMFAGEWGLDVKALKNLLINKKVPPNEILIVWGDDADEVENLFWFVTRAPEFAKICKAKELGFKLENSRIVRLAHRYEDLIIRSDD